MYQNAYVQQLFAQLCDNDSNGTEWLKMAHLQGKYRPTGAEIASRDFFYDHATRPLSLQMGHIISSATG